MLLPLKDWACSSKEQESVISTRKSRIFIRLSIKLQITVLFEIEIIVGSQLTRILERKFGYNDNYFNLNVFATQLSVGITFYVLLDLLRSRYRQRLSIGWKTVMFVLFVVTQVMFLLYCNRMVRSFYEKEYKEMLIPLSYLVFTMGVIRKVKLLKSSMAVVTKREGEIRIVRQSATQEAV